MYTINKKAFKEGENKEALFKEDIVAFVKSEFTKRREERLPFELEWVLNINFIEGNQFLEINADTNTIQPIVKEFWWQVQDVFNQIAPIFETRLAKLSRVTPLLKVRPASSDPDDLGSAKVTQKLLEITFRSQEMGKKVKNSNIWLEATGTIIYKPVWDKHLGKTLTLPSSDDKKMIIKEGDISTVLVPPFEFYPDTPYVEDVQDCGSIIHARAYSSKDVKSLWGIDEEGKEITVFSLNRGSLVSNKSLVHTVSSMTKDDAVMVYEYWEKPSALYPKGRFILCTDNHLITVSDLMYKVGPGGDYGYPFVVCKSIERPGLLWGKSIVSRLLPLQKRYNSIKSRKAEYLNRASIGQMTYEEGSIDEESLEEEGLAPGSMIPYRRGFAAPRYMEYHGLPSTFETEEHNILQDFNRISGVSEISRDSKAPTGVNSGIALSILQEQDDTRLSLTAENIENMHIEIGKMWIRLYRQFATEKRMLRFSGSQSSIDVAYWKSSDLTSEDIFIDASSKLSETPAQRKQMVFDLLNSGLFNDPETGVISKEGRLKIFEMLEMGNWENFDDDDSLHAHKAQRENMKILSGNEARVVEYDDDVVHINKHNAFRLTSDYEDLIAENPELEEAFEAHVSEHLQALQEKAQAMMPQNPQEMPDMNQEELEGGLVDEAPV